MTKKQLNTLVLISAFFLVYFYSESVLRQAAIALVDTDNIKVENIISKLPQGIREGIKKEIEIASLRDNMLNAVTDSDKINAAISLALSLDNRAEKETLFADVIRNYPSVPEASLAYTYFLMEQNNPAVSISIKDYHEYIKKCPEESRFYIWSAGIGKLKQINAPYSTQLEFLKPLLNIEPKYKDFQYLYEYLYDISRKLGDNKSLQLSQSFEEKCSDLPFIEEFLSKQQEKKK